MIRQYYVEQVTRLSRWELESVFQIVEPPACLIGGWAVYFHVNNGFQREHGRGYIGSRDIDLGVHVDPRWTPTELPDKPVGKLLVRLEDELGYTRSRFGFLQYFHRESGDRLSEREANDYPMHEVFEVFVDVVPDTVELDAFEKAFGFRPPAEPLLTLAFERAAAEPLSSYVSWDVSNLILIAKPALVAAMKIRSIPHRDKSYKRVKDIADLHALLWYIRDYNEMRDDVFNYVSRADLQQLKKSVDTQLFEATANLLQIDSKIIRGSINRLTLS